LTSLYPLIADLEARGEPAVVCTIVRTRGSVPRHASGKMVVRADGAIHGTVGGGELESRVRAAALEVLAANSPALLNFALRDPAAGDPGVCGGEVEIYLEPLRLRPTLLVIGGGHVGKALAHLAKWVGFRVVVSDDRADQCVPGVIPGGDLYLPVPIAELPRHFAFTNDTWIVLPTRGVPVDVAGLPVLLAQPRAYLGVIGSRRRWRTTVERLTAAGVSPEQLATIHSPMGLELNAETPEEIAVSVLAEILQLRNGGDGGPMRVRSAES